MMVTPSEYRRKSVVTTSIHSIVCVAELCTNFEGYRTRLERFCP
jgi:hypothetical protein